MKFDIRNPLLFVLLGSTLVVGPSLAWAESAGTVKTIKGLASIERNGQKFPATVGTGIEASDRVTTGPESAIGITLRDNTMLSAGPNSTLMLNRFAFNTTTHVGALDARVQRGTLSVISGKIAKANPDAVVFSTPDITLGVRGTEFIIDAGQPEE
jgi:hypothetical protein